MIRKTFYIIAVGLISIFCTTYSFANPSPHGDVPRGPAFPYDQYGRIPILLNLPDGQEWRGSVKLLPNVNNTRIGIVSIYEESGSFINSYNYSNLSGRCEEFTGGGLISPSKSGSLSFTIPGFIEEINDSGITIYFNRIETHLNDDDTWQSSVLWDFNFHNRNNFGGCNGCDTHTNGFFGMCSTFHIP